MLFRNIPYGKVFKISAVTYSIHGCVTALDLVIQCPVTLSSDTVLLNVSIGDCLGIEALFVHNDGLLRESLTLFELVDNVENVG